MKRAFLALVLFGALGCFSITDQRGLALAEADIDFESYHLRRVGLVPFAAQEGDRVHTRMVQGAFLHAFASQANFEVVLLDEQALAEVEPSQPYRRGRLRPMTVLELSRRFSLDGLLMGTITQVSAYPPQVLGLEIDLVACETGLPIWSSRIQLDASDANVHEALMTYYREQERTGKPEGASLTLISPTRFARFAAHQVAETLPAGL